MDKLDWGSVADWVSGIGSLLAIVTSLYLSMKDNYKKLLVSFGFNYYVYEGGDISNDSFFSIDIVNKGKIPVKINKIGFCKFKINKYLPDFIQRISPSLLGMSQAIVLREDSEKLPFMIESQEMVSFSLKGKASTLSNNEYVSRKTRVYVQDSTGKIYFSQKKVKF